MQKNAYKIIALTLLLMLLCGCKQSRSLGERAIVKMVYLDESGGQVQAGLVVFTCAPNSDTASVEGQAKIYTAQGKSIEEALYKAEQQQNKKPFYAQNEILLLGPGAARNVTPYLSYFADENAARPNLAAFLTPLTAEELSECEDVISDVVREGERLIGMGADEQDRTQIDEEIIECEAWTRYTFPARAGQYSQFVWDYKCFSGIDHIENPTEDGVFKIVNDYTGEGWNEQVDDELGNFDYLMGANIDFRNHAVTEEIKYWARWVMEQTGCDGFRLDAVKHIPAFIKRGSSMFRRWPRSRCLL